MVAGGLAVQTNILSGCDVWLRLSSCVCVFHRRLYILGRWSFGEQRWTTKRRQLGSSSLLASLDDSCWQRRRRRRPESDAAPWERPESESSAVGCRSWAQHSSSASLMGGIKLLVDLYWLTWLRARVFAGLICVLLRWGLSCSSVNHVFSDKETKRGGGTRLTAPGGMLHFQC